MSTLVPMIDQVTQAEAAGTGVDVIAVQALLVQRLVNGRGQLARWMAMWN